MKKYYLLIIVISLITLSACNSQSSSNITEIVPTNIPTPALSPIVNETNKMCDWIDKSEVIVKLNFAPEIVTKDTSYELGFVYSKPDKPQLELKLARVARSQCDYRVGFNKSDFNNIAHANLAAWTYNGTVRQTLKGDPILVNFIDNLPNLGKQIEVETIGP